MAHFGAVEASNDSRHVSNAPLSEKAEKMLPYKTRTFKEAYKLGKLLGHGTYGSVWLCTVKEGQSPPCEESRGHSPGSAAAQVEDDLRKAPEQGPVAAEDSSQKQDRKGKLQRSITSDRVSVQTKGRASNPLVKGSSHNKGGEAPQELRRTESDAAKRHTKKHLEEVQKACPEQYAVKMVPKSMLTSTHKRDDLRREIALLRLLGGNHRNIVQLLEVLENPKSISLVLEYCNGGDLFDLLCSRGRLPEAAARFLFQQMASAVAFCHEHGVMHRDIKPENILFSGDPPSDLQSMVHVDSPPWDVTVKLADFGLSTVIGQQGMACGFHGSRYYTAPEMVRGWTYGMGADVWSLGVVLFAMLTGRLPFAGKDDDDNEGIERAILSGRIDFRQSVWAGVSSEAKDLVRRMLQVDPMKRIHAEEVLSHPWVQGRALPNVEGSPLRRGEVDGEKGRRVTWDLMLECSSMESEASCISRTTLDTESPSPVGIERTGFDSKHEGGRKFNEQDKAISKIGTVKGRMQLMKLWPWWHTRKACASQAG